MADNTIPTRNQIARLVGDDPKMVKALERLFIVANDLTPTEISTLTQLITDNSYAIGASDNKADVASSIAYAAQQIANLVALQPMPIDPMMERLQDVVAFAPNDEDILQYDVITKKWESGANPSRISNTLLWLEAY